MGEKTIHCICLCVMMMVICGEAFPKDYNFDIKAECGKYLRQDKPRVKIVADLDIVAYAVCANGVKDFVSFDGVNHILNASFYKSNSICVFKRRKNTNVYSIEVRVAYGDGDKMIQKNYMKRIITCTFGLHSTRLSDQHRVLPGLASPNEVRVDAGRKTSSKLSLDVYDVDDKRITGPVRSGRPVYLAATTDGRNREVGIRPVSCSAISSSTGERTDILRSGCGVGYIFDQKEGFYTKNKRVRSPYFKMFQLNADTKISFECSFTLCATNCDGSSCTRFKRSVSKDERVVLRTDVAVLVD